MDTPRERDEEEAQNINITPVRSTTVQRLQVYLERRMAQRNITTEEQQNTEEVGQGSADPQPSSHTSDNLSSGNMQCNNADLTSESDSSLSVSNASNWTCDNIEPQLPMSRQGYAGDRYIPMRRGYSFEAAYHLLKKNTQLLENDTIIKRDHNSVTIDIRKQVSELKHMHQSRAMRAALKAFSPLVVSQNTILRITNSVATQTESLNLVFETNWKCKPRQQKLIQNSDELCSIPNYIPQNLENPYFVKNMVDWNNANILAIASERSIRLFSNLHEPKHKYENYIDVHPQLEEEDKIVAIKSSNVGYDLAVATKETRLMLIDMLTKKRMWQKRMCKCVIMGILCECETSGICWDKNDNIVIVGFQGNLKFYQKEKGEFVQSYYMHEHGIICMAFSSDYKYIATTGKDSTLRVFEWENFEYSILTVHIYGPVQAIAWHPEEPILCTGGGYNGVLTFWHAKKEMKIGIVRNQSRGIVKDLLWNKLSCELIVHWAHTDGHEQDKSIVVFGNFTRIVDAIPDVANVQISFLMFNPTHNKLMSYSSSTEIFTFWNFFGNDKSVLRKYQASILKRRRNGPLDGTIR